MSITRETFGRLPDGREVSLFTLSNSRRVTVKVINYGCIITSVTSPDRDGNIADVVLGYDSLEPYMKNPSYFGAAIGRYANRIENAAFELSGTTYDLMKNDGNNHLHGGGQGFDKRLWDAHVENGRLEFTYQSSDGEEGYPGKLDVKVTYILDEACALSIRYDAVSDKDTIVNLTNHAYFNLSGHDAGDIGGHKLRINANSYTPINDECIPTGEMRPVKGTPFDFSLQKQIGEGLGQENDDEQMRFGHGYDHNFVINNRNPGLNEAAELYDPRSGRHLTVVTDKPGIQFYTGNFIDSTLKGKGGIYYGKRTGLCLETQHFPNSPNCKSFPSPMLKAGDNYKFMTLYIFSADIT